ncbi:hypothetical protein MSG28_012935 [Choristoneura fumiferana]|uniref:Uncharacterized protein n=1 Tax=Choristoneura fumiferana TaxID=7141 RepID=A0ACC0KS19_CHOFU|nr:hypothetical protein MSG28_012935 [Choristoneura fumiferana]
MIAQSWIAACQRPDLINKTAKQLYNMHVCSLHFEKWMYINKKLKDAALPSLNLPNTRAMEQVGAQTIQIVEDSIRGGIKSENDTTSPDLAAVPSTSAKTPTKQKKKPKKTIYRITSLKTKEVVFNIHQYYQNRKWDTKNWEYEVDLNINNQVSKITGLSEGTVRKIVRDCRVFKPNVKTTAERLDFGHVAPKKKGYKPETLCRAKLDLRRDMYGSKLSGAKTSL